MTLVLSYTRWRRLLIAITLRDHHCAAAVAASGYVCRLRRDGEEFTGIGGILLINVKTYHIC